MFTATGRPGAALRSALLVLGLGGVPLIAQAHEIVYYGRATAVQGHVQVSSLTGKVLLADVGMSCNGSPREEVALKLRNPPPLSLEVDEVRSYTEGKDGVARTESGINELELSVPGLTISAENINSYAQAECFSDETVKVSGGSVFASLTINGEGVTVSGEPNQTIEIPNVAKIVINEQVKYSREFRVIGVHVTLFNADTPINGDIRLAAARAKIKTCDMT